MSEPTKVQLEAEADRLRAQLGKCGELARGEVGPGGPANRGDYAWSPVYQDVLNLKVRVTELESSLLSDLEWGSRSLQELNWEDAQAWCAEHGPGWRWPTRVELIEACDSNVEGFGEIAYWSSTEYIEDPAYAWYVDFSDGAVYADVKTDALYVRCVRAIPSR